MQPDEDPRKRTRVERQFAAIVDRLKSTDPHFARRFSVPALSAYLSAGAVMALVGAVATLLLGIVPLAVGVSSHAVELLTLGALCCAVLPVAAPVVTGRVLGHVRPLWA